MKKISFGLTTALLLASPQIFAATPTKSLPFEVTVPSLEPGVEFNIEGLYLRPTNSDIDYATVNPANTNTNSLSYGVKTIHPTYNFGFKLGIGYIFPESGNDLHLNWTHFSNSTSNSSSAAAGEVIEPNYGLGSYGSFNQAYGKLQNRYDAIDADAGQFMDVGTRLRLRFFGGLRYAEINSDITSSVTNGNAVNYQVNNSTNRNNSRFIGLGPRLGIDGVYHLNHNFGITWGFAGSTLAGKIKSNENVIDTTANGTSTVTSTSTNNVNRLVPNLDAKIGLDYSVDSAVTVEGGYKFSQYFGAVDRFNFVGVPALGINRVTSNIGFNGPYLSLNVKI